MDDVLMAALLSAGAAGFLCLAYMDFRVTRQRETFRAAIANAGTDLFDWLVAMAPSEKESLRSLFRSRYSTAAMSQIILDRTNAEEMGRQMERMWFVCPNDVASTDWEDRCVDVLAESLHLLFPELKPLGTTIVDNAISTFLNQQFGITDTAARAARYKFAPHAGRLPDICGYFEVESHLSSMSTRATGATILIVEAKNPNETVSHKVMDEAFNYAHDLLRLWQPDLPVHFECLAVAGRIDDGVGPMARLGGQGLASITVTPITWRELMNRATRITRLDPYPKVVLSGRGH